MKALEGRMRRHRTRRQRERFERIDRRIASLRVAWESASATERQSIEAKIRELDRRAELLTLEGK